jgi:hypothetical protein
LGTVRNWATVRVRVRVRVKYKRASGASSSLEIFHKHTGKSKEEKV